MGQACKCITNRESHITNFPPTFLTYIQIIHDVTHIQIIELFQPKCSRSGETSAGEGGYHIFPIL